MRQIILDTETTGLDPRQDHRIIELAAVEIIDRRVTGRHLHLRIDPERDIDTGATEVHGMTREDLAGEPRFADVAARFVDFARDTEWIIHNAPFDIGFLDAELARAGLAPCSAIYARLTDTLVLARDAFPGKRNNLDALCERFGVSNAERTRHTALLDASLLAEVYLRMTRGQETLTIDAVDPAPKRRGAAGSHDDLAARTLVAVTVSDEQAVAHREYLEALARESKGGCIWLALDAETRIDAPAWT
ncbi:MAG: DNA polymerase III subunit epsilon [Proteobacteria bacterium]|nr:DNA polymerase III subunit epsilon [Pseudomonadota bacterium]